jgi:hypothetical protein
MSATEQAKDGKNEGEGEVVYPSHDEENRGEFPFPNPSIVPQLHLQPTAPRQRCARVAAAHPLPRSLRTARQKWRILARLGLR